MKTMWKKRLMKIIGIDQIIDGARPLGSRGTKRLQRRKG